MKYKPSGIICVIAGALTAVAVALAQDAHADEASFIAAVNDDGLPVTANTLALGHLICQDIIAHGTRGVRDEMDMADAAGVSSKDAAALVVDAVYELCPYGLPAVHAFISSSKGV